MINLYNSHVSFILKIHWMFNLYNLHVSFIFKNPLDV